MGRRINARDAQWWTGDPTTTLQNILKYAPGNSLIVYLPYEENSPWWLPKEGIRIERPLELYGDGLDEANGLRYWTDPTVPDLKGTKDSNGLVMAWPNIYLHDLTLSNNRGFVGKGAGNAISFLGTQRQNGERNDFHDVIWNIVLERLRVHYAGNHGFYSHPPFPQAENGGWGFLIVTSMRDCSFFGSSRCGIKINAASTTLEFEQVSTPSSGEWGVWIEGSINGAMKQVVAEGSGNDFDPAEPNKCAIYMRDCEGMDLRFYTESFAKGGVRDAIILDNLRQSYLRPSAIYEWDVPDLVGVRMRSCTRVTVESQATTGLKYSVYDEGKKSTGCTVDPQESPVYMDRRRNEVRTASSR